MNLKSFLRFSLFLAVCAGFAAAPVNASGQSAASNCPALPTAGGHIVHVSSVAALQNAVNNAASGDTILIADGVYNLDGVYLRIDTPNVSLRSASGNRAAVVLDGNYLTTEIVQAAASGVTIADLTLREAYDHAIHVMSTDQGHTLDTLIYNVHVVDPGQQAIKINPAAAGYYTDNGVIACSHIALSDAGRSHIRDNCYTGGIDAHQSRGWTIRDNLIEGFWCDQGLAEHGIHLWRGCRDTLIERNVLRDNARGIGLGLVTSGSGRTYADNPCPAASGYVDDFGGTIRNNFIAANNSSLFASDYGFDCGICLWNACNARALHNTVFTANTGSTFSAIEWRFANTQAEITNNLANDTYRERDGAHGTQSNNLSSAQASWFVAASSGDLHLVASATAAIDRVAAAAGAPDDVDGDPRPSGAAADIGADEYRLPGPARVTDLRLAAAELVGGNLTITLRWSPPPEAGVATLRYSRAPITAANWDSATLLAGDLPSGTQVYAATLPYSGGTIFFTLKTRGDSGLWSELSNNTFWPRFDRWLPLVMK